MKVGILIETSPEHQNGHTVIALSKAFLSAQHEIRLFLMDDGIYPVVKNHTLGAAEQLASLCSEKNDGVNLHTIG